MSKEKEGREKHNKRPLIKNLKEKRTAKEAKRAKRNNISKLALLKIGSN